MVQSHGLDLFYDSTEMRQLCCNVRKVLPLNRKLKEFDAWATGLRRGTRQVPRGGAESVGERGPPEAGAGC
jgi:hypothetical protein